MIRHLFKLLWNRKRASALVVVEITLSFLVLAAVIGGVAHFAINWQRPLGYDPANVFTLDLELPSGRETRDPDARVRFAALLRELEAMPGVESVAGANMPPYSMSESTTDFERGGGWYSVNGVTDRFAETMRLELTAGRWFGPEDDGVDVVPVVLNEEAVRLRLPGQNPVGAILNSTAEAGVRKIRVVGVVREYRKGGELQSPQAYAFMRVNLSDPEASPPAGIVIRSTPGAGTEFEVSVLERARLVAPEWTFEIRPLSVSRRGALRLQFAPLIAGAVIAASMILLVALGLTGVMWQNVTRRTQEIGLRRALGASSASVQAQIILETLIVASIGLTAGLLVAIQAPLSGMLSNVRPEVLATGLAGAAVTILVIVSLCAWYPSRLASSVEPSEALHYE